MQTSRTLSIRPPSSVSSQLPIQAVATSAMSARSRRCSLLVEIGQGCAASPSASSKVIDQTKTGSVAGRFPLSKKVSNTMQTNKRSFISLLILFLLVSPALMARERLLPGSEQNPNAAAPDGLGAKKVAVILFNFSNDPVEPYTPGWVRQRLMTDPDSTNLYFREVSFGALELTGHLRALSRIRWHS